MKYFKLTLLAGLLFVVTFCFWSPSSSFGVNIHVRQGRLGQKLFNDKIEDLISGYPDIAYHIKDDVARFVCVYQHNFCWTNSPFHCCVVSLQLFTLFISTQ